MSSNEKTYKVSFWSGLVKLEQGASAREVALQTWDAEYLDRFSVAEDLVPEDTMVILSRYYDDLAKIEPYEPSRPVFDEQNSRNVEV